MAAQYLLVVTDQLRLATRRSEVVQAAEIEAAAIRWRKRRLVELFVDPVELLAAPEFEIIAEPWRLGGPV